MLVAAYGILAFWSCGIRKVDVQPAPRMRSIFLDLVRMVIELELRLEVVDSYGTVV